MKQEEEEEEEEEEDGEIRDNHKVLKIMKTFL